MSELRSKFRNISRIMNCVTCEKCKLWGKLQILGIGTAIKILLLNNDEIIKKMRNNEMIVNRQELIALINTLHQLCNSLKFAAHAKELELAYKLGTFQKILPIVEQSYIGVHHLLAGFIGGFQWVYVAIGFICSCIFCTFVPFGKRARK